MSDADKDQSFYEDRGFGQSVGFGRKPVLIVVDLICGFSDPELPLGSDLSPEIAAVNRLIEACRARGVGVVFTTSTYDDDALSDAGMWARKMKGLQTLRAGTRAVEIDPRLDKRPGDGLIDKKYASAFYGTHLLARLMAQGVDTAIITGASTSGCVRATVVDAIQGGLRPIVVREAVGDRSKVAHDQSLFDMQTKYADVLSLEETLAHVNAVRLG